MRNTVPVHTNFSGLLALIMLLSGFFAGAQNADLFKQGNDLYNQGEYQMAVDKYKEIEASGMHSSALYFNMANAYYKLNSIAPSILYYEKALLLDPEDEDTRINLAYARNMTIDDIAVLPQTGLSKLFENLVGTFSYDTWSYLSIGAIVLFVCFFIVYYFAYGQGRKRLLFTVSVVWLFLSVGSLIFAFQERKWTDQRDPAIVFARETTVKSEPNLGSDEIFRLHEGAKVFVLDTMNNWMKIQLTDGKEGWLPAEELRKIKDF